MFKETKNFFVDGGQSRSTIYFKLLKKTWSQKINIAIKLLLKQDESIKTICKKYHNLFSGQIINKNDCKYHYCFFNFIPQLKSVSKVSYFVNAVIKRLKLASQFLIYSQH